MLSVSVRPDVLALAEEAAHEIGRFDVEVGAEVAPFVAVLLRSESASSSQFENVATGAKALAVAALGDAGRQNIRDATGSFSHQPIGMLAMAISSAHPSYSPPRLPASRRVD